MSMRLSPPRVGISVAKIENNSEIDTLCVYENETKRQQDGFDVVFTGLPCQAKNKRSSDLHLSYIIRE